MKIITSNKSLRYGIANVSNTGEVKEFKLLPEWAGRFVNEVKDQSIIDWYSNRKDKLNPEFMLKKVEEDGKLFLELKVSDSLIRVRDHEVNIQSKKMNFYLIRNSIKKCLDIAQDWAAIMYYEEHPEGC